MAAKIAHRTVSRRARTIIGTTLAAGTIAGALALGAPAFADAPATGASALSPEALGTAGAQEGAVQVFADAGYSSYDSAELARQWKIADPYDAEVIAGTKLAAGQALPIEARSTPQEPAAVPAAEMAAVDALSDAGYTLDDARALAAQWKIASFWQAKVTAGNVLLAGQALPIEPGSSPNLPCYEGDPSC